MVQLFLQGALLGLGATILFDLWGNFVVPLLPGQRRPSWAPVGRWFRHLGNGRVFHEDIGAAEPYANELSLGWAGHYAIGILYGIAFALIVGPGWLAAPRFLPAWIFGIATLGFGWFLLQPGMGAGVAAARTPNPAMARALGLAAHTVFGLGLYLTARVIG